MLKKIEQGKLSELVTALIDQGPLYAPVRDDRGVNFQSIRSPLAVTLDFYNSVLSPKAVFFPQSEDLISYRLGRGEPTAKTTPLPTAQTILLGVRPPDAYSFFLMDELFLGSGIVDPYWQSRRDLTVVIGYPFINQTPDAVDFYSSLGISATDTRGSDIFLIKKNGELLFKGLTEKGNSLLAKQAALFTEATGDDEQYYLAALAQGAAIVTRNLDCDPKRTASKLENLFADTAFWEQMAAACISCGTCTFVCPTCHCFDIADENIFRDGVRRRFWDACMFTDFTLEASGHNPRSRVYQRLRQKVCHKYSYYIRNFGVISCVGCGRCTRSCPVNIDIFTIIAEAMKK